MARISKKQLKEDKLLTTTAKISMFLNQHWQKIAAIVAAMVVLLGLIVLYVKFMNIRNEKAVRILIEAKTLFTEAETAMDSNGKTDSTVQKYEQAKAKFDEAARKSKRGDTASRSLFYSAKSSYQIGRYEEAISAFQKLARKYSKSVYAPYAQEGIAYSYEQLGGDDNLRKAIQEYDRLSKYPETYISIRAFIDKGRCYEKLREWDKAIGEYNNIVERFKSNLESSIQATSRDCVRKAKEVISKYQDALGKSQSDQELVKLAMEKEKQEQWFEALKKYDEAIASRKEYWSQQKVSDAANAMEEYEKLSADMVKNVSLGRKHEKQGDWDSAVRYYSRAIKFDFLPNMDLFEVARYRVNWINSLEKPSSGQVTASR